MILKFDYNDEMQQGDNAIRRESLNHFFMTTIKNI